MKHHHYLAALTAMLFALSACGKAGAPDAADKSAANEPAVATVNGKNLSAAAFDMYATSVARKPLGELTVDQKNQILDQFIGIQLAADAAEKANLEKGKETAIQLSLMRTNILAEAQAKKYLDEHPVSDAEIKAEYDAQVTNLPKEYHASHILVENKVIADSIIRDLKKGVDFAKLAKEQSKDPSGKNGGDLGWFTPDTMVKPFADALVTLEKGKFTEEPVESKFGWHVILLQDTRTATPPDFDQVKDRVKQFVQRKKWAAYVDELRKTAKIEKKS